MKNKTYLAIDTPVGTRAAYLNLDFPNANSQFPLTLKICKECDLGHEHVVQEVELRVWGS